MHIKSLFSPDSTPYKYGTLHTFIFGRRFFFKNHFILVNLVLKNVKIMLMAVANIYNMRCYISYISFCLLSVLSILPFFYSLILYNCAIVCAIFNDYLFISRHLVVFFM